MRLESLKFRGLGPFKGEQTVALTELDATLVAVVGSNGAGKSTLNELFPSALYREGPTRGKLSKLATERDAFVEATVVNGSRYTIRQSVDAISGKGEALVLDADGDPVLGDAKVTSFGTWAAKHLPPPEVFYASVFAAQGSGGLLAMKAAERKQVLLRALGIEQLEALAEGARRHRAETSRALDTLRARIDDERERGGDAEALAAELAQAQQAAVQADAEVEKARGAVADAERLGAEYERALAAVEERRQRAAELEQQRAGLRQGLGELDKQAADIERRIANNQDLLGRASEIREAEARAEQLKEEITQAEADCRAAEEESKRAASNAAALSQRQEQALQRADRARSRLRDRERVAVAVKALPDLERAVVQAQQDSDQAAQELHRLQRERLAGAEERIFELREGLATITLDWSDAAGVADRTLQADDETVWRAATLPADVAAAEGIASDAARALTGATRARDDAARLAGRSQEMADAEADLAAAEKEANDLDGERAAAGVQAEAESGRAARLRGRPGQLRRERDALAPLLARVAPLAQAEARIAELRPQLEGLGARIDRATKDLDALPGPLSPQPLPSPAPAVAPLRAALESAEKRARGAHGQVAVLGQRLEAARQSAARALELDAERVALDQQLADWTRLDEDLGKKGLQALEIDAAGPEISTLTNDLLHEAFGPRFTVRLDTTKPSADGKRELESFDVTVIDTERGREAPAETLSGGERVIVSEALSLALTMVACRRAGVERPTLVRDESGAALDAENGRRYVAMLRRAAGIVGADKVLFVSHSRELWELADARIVVADGGVTVEVDGG